MKRFFYYIIWAGALTVSYYLYMRQLGAIPFFLLSLYFFIRAKKEFSKRPEQDVGGKGKLNRKKIPGTKQ